jgi:hypothetical protein
MLNFIIANNLDIMSKGNRPTSGRKSLTSLLPPSMLAILLKIGMYLRR